MQKYKFSQLFNANQQEFENHIRILQNFGVPNTYIEIGVYEGRTCFWFSDYATKYNSKLKIYAIDPHHNSFDINYDEIQLDKTFTDVKNNFEYNLYLHQYKNVHYINKTSTQGLLQLINEGVQAEFIFIDGDHTASTVLSDLVLAWQLLKKGGVIVCDDALWQYQKVLPTPLQLSPRLAIESFMNCNWHKITPIVTTSYQTAFLKIAD